MRSAALASTALLALLAGTAAAGATNATLKSTIDVWSKKLGADAQAVALDARLRHPHRMTSDALRFRRDALRARAATRAQHASTAKGRRASRVALAAFHLYALAGSRWAACGRARIAARRPQALALATEGARDAKTGNTLLVRAGRLLR